MSEIIGSVNKKVAVVVLLAFAAGGYVGGKVGSLPVVWYVFEHEDGTMTSGRRNVDKGFSCMCIDFGGAGIKWVGENFNARCGTNGSFETTPFTIAEADGHPTRNHNHGMNRPTPSEACCRGTQGKPSANGLNPVNVPNDGDCV